MKKKWIKKFTSFKQADKADMEYYLKMNPGERLASMQFLIETYRKLKGEKQDEINGRLRRVIRVIQQT